MTGDSDSWQVLSLQGEVVEILDRPGRRQIKVSVAPGNVVSVIADCPPETHLGDRVILVMRAVVRRVIPE